MAKFVNQNGNLFIDGKKVIKAWESYTGWYWFGTERVWTQDSILNDRVVENDQIWFGLAQGFEEEWGYFSQGEIESLGKHRVWKIKAHNLPYSGRRN